jgi:hypothetical protein
MLLAIGIVGVVAIAVGGIWNSACAAAMVEEVNRTKVVPPISHSGGPDRNWKLYRIHKRIFPTSKTRRHFRSAGFLAVCGFLLAGFAMFAPRHSPSKPLNVQMAR